MLGFHVIGAGALAEGPETSGGAVAAIVAFGAMIKRYAIGIVASGFGCSAIHRHTIGVQ